MNHRKDYYHEDPEYRRKVIERSKREYRKHRKRMFKLTDTERQLLRDLNCYPNLMPGWSGGLGTSGLSTNLSIIEVEGKERVKGALWLEKEIKKKTAKKIKKVDSDNHDT